MNRSEWDVHQQAVRPEGDAYTGAPHDAPLSGPNAMIVHVVRTRHDRYFSLAKCSNYPGVEVSKDMHTSWLYLVQAITCAHQVWQLQTKRKVVMLHP